MIDVTDTGKVHSNVQESTGMCWLCIPKENADYSDFRPEQSYAAHRDFRRGQVMNGTITETNRIRRFHTGPDQVMNGTITETNRIRRFHTGTVQVMSGGKET